jgi:Lar family restriction alleviation protein
MGKTFNPLTQGETMELYAINKKYGCIKKIPEHAVGWMNKLEWITYATFPDEKTYFNTFQSISGAIAMSEMIDLKPCPFCGEKDVHLETQTATIDNEDVNFYRVYCPGCAGWTEWALDKEKTIEIWNTRSIPSSNLPSDEEIADKMDSGEVKGLLNDQRIIGAAIGAKWMRSFCQHSEQQRYEGFKHVAFNELNHFYLQTSELNKDASVSEVLQAFRKEKP